MNLSIKIILIFVHLILSIICLLFFLLTLLIRKKVAEPRLLFGLEPLISNKYWANAMKKSFPSTKSFMKTFYTGINDYSDFDSYQSNLKIFKVFPDKAKERINNQLGGYFSFIYIINNFDIIHCSFKGGPLGNTYLKKIEGFLYKKLNIKIIVLGYGGDFYMYSKVLNPFWRHGLVINYPETAKREKEIEKRVHYWTKYADCIINAFQIDGIPKYDLLPVNALIIDTDKWYPKKRKIKTAKEAIRILHTPNHRGVKGTEFLVQAVEELKTEGYNIQLRLLEGVKNKEVLNIMQEQTDILVSQLNIDAYAMSAIEGMACGIPVICNLEEIYYAPLLRRFSYLKECPILSATPESIKEQLKLLIENPKLRETLGKANREYVKKYHSFKTAQYMFSKVYDKIWYGKNVDLINMFHPILKNSYNNSLPKINHPLVNNKLPDSYFEKEIFA